MSLNPYYSHSRPQSPRSFWPVARIESSGWTRFSEHAQSSRFEILNQSDLLDLTEVFQFWTKPELSIPATGQKDLVLWGREGTIPGSWIISFGLRDKESIGHFTVVCSVTWPLRASSRTGVDLALIQTSLLF